MMDDTKDMRFWMDKTKEISDNESFWEYVKVTPNKSGLPVDVLLDDNSEYLTNNHELWLYIRDFNNNLIPVTISDKPIFKKPIRIELECLKKLVTFIKENQLIIKRLADKEIDYTRFCAILKPVETVEKQFIYEMATLSPQKSGLPTVLWLDDDKKYLPHAPRIKFRADRQNKNTNNDPSMEIQNPDRIHRMEKCDLSAKELKQIKSFVKANEKALLDLANNVIEFDGFLSTMKIININGEIETNNEITYGKKVNGFVIAQKGNKYNYVNNNGDFLYPDFELDYADNFMNYNGKLIAFVGKNDVYFYIDNNGKQIIL